MQYTDEQVQQVMDAQKCNRIKAIHLIKRMASVEKAVAYVNAPPVAKAAKPKAAKKVREAVDLPKKSSDKVKVNMDKLDTIIREALAEAYGHPCPILGVLGQRFAVPSQSQGYPFYRVLAECGGPGKSDLQACYVGGLHHGDAKLWKVSMTSAVKSSYTVASLLKRIEKRAKREAAKAAEAKRTAAVPAKSAKK